MTASRFLLIVLAVFAGLGGSYLAAFRATWSQSLNPDDALRAVAVVKERLVAETPSPRWLIVGGSSAWFGFDSTAMARATNQRVINLGVHAEIPLWFQLETAERLAQPGDTVLLAAELHSYWRKRPTTFGATKLGPLAPDAFARANGRHQRELLAAIPPSHVLFRLVARAADDGRLAGSSAGELLANLRAHWSGNFSGEKPAHYNYLDLDLHGDFSRARLPAAHPRDNYDLATEHEAPTAVWEDIAAAARRLRARAVTCRFTWPPFERHEGVDFDSAAARKNFADLQRRLAAAGWQELGRVEDAIFDPEYFHDTAHHLTTDGARRRTERLVERLRAEGTKR